MKYAEDAEYKSGSDTKEGERLLLGTSVKIPYAVSLLCEILAEIEGYN